MRHNLPHLAGDLEKQIDGLGLDFVSFQFLLPKIFKVHWREGGKLDGNQLDNPP